jgi:GT2 family glycosyltransferase
MTPEPLGIVVVTFGAHELLAANLVPLDLAAANARVVVVDNFHSDDERAATRAIAEAHGWAFLPMAGNVGFGAGMNRGVAHAHALGCTTTLLLNPDARVSVEVIAELDRAVRADPMTLVSPRLLRADGSVWFQGSYLDERTGNVGGATGGGVGGSAGAGAAGRVEWLTAACLMVHRDLWAALDGFDPDYFLYWEDTDLSRRCVELGGRLSVRRDLVAGHDVGGTQVAVGKSSAYYYYNCRNRLLFAAKHLSRGRVLRWIVYTPVASRHILYRGGGRRQMLRSPGLLWAAVRGSVVGVGLAVRALVHGPRPAVAGRGRASLAAPSAVAAGPPDRAAPPW